MHGRERVLKGACLRGDDIVLLGRCQEALPLHLCRRGDAIGRLILLHPLKQFLGDRCINNSRGALRAVLHGSQRYAMEAHSLSA